MSTPYAFTLELDQPLPAAIETLRAALAAEQLGIVSEVDVQATMKNKLGLDGHPQKLLGICSPQVAHALLTAEPDIGAMLPCGCSVSEAVPGRTRIALQDPRVIGVVSGQIPVRVALPTMREYPFRVALEREPGNLTVLSLVQGRVVAVQHRRDAAALGAALSP